MTAEDEADYECEACSAKSGSPTLCADCLERRRTSKNWKGPRPRAQHTCRVSDRIVNDCPVPGCGNGGGRRTGEAQPAVDPLEELVRFMVEHRRWAEEPGRLPMVESRAVVSALNSMIQFAEVGRRARERRSEAARPGAPTLAEELLARDRAEIEKASPSLRAAVRAVLDSGALFGWPGAEALEKALGDEPCPAEAPLVMGDEVVHDVAAEHAIRGFGRVEGTMHGFVRVRWSKNRSEGWEPTTIIHKLAPRRERGPNAAPRSCSIPSFGDIGRTTTTGVAVHVENLFSTARVYARTYEAKTPLYVLGEVAVKLTDAAVAYAIIETQLHPTGACSCAGEGKCDWCRSTAERSKKVIFDPYCQPWMVTLRQAKGAQTCVDEECELSGYYSHAGPCEPCSCPLKHAVEECPLNRTDACRACKGTGHLTCLNCKGVGLFKAHLEHAKTKSEGQQIIEWLQGLENILQRDVASGRFPDLASRRGIYVGIADDIKRLWPGLFT